MGRQSIVDRAGAVVGFELLYRPVIATAAARDGEQMTASVVLSTLAIGIEELVGSKTIFCNAGRGALVGDTPITLPPSRTVIEVLETVFVDDEVLEGCGRLVDAGFRLALDDFEWIEGSERVLELASIVKIDFQAVPAEDIPALMARCRHYDVVLLAEKVETPEQLALAHELGFELFQGYIVERPLVVRGRTLSTSIVARAQLAMTVLSSDLDFAEIEEILRAEPALAVQVLQIASVGSQHGLRRRVRNLREALVLLGSLRIRQWIALSILGSQPGGAPDGIAAALLRARIVEILARSRGLPDVEIAFTAGLLSALDLLVGVDSDRLIAAMNIDQQLSDAVFRAGPLGELVGEVADYQTALASGDSASVTPDDMDRAATSAFAWAVPYLSRFE